MLLTGLLAKYVNLSDGPPLSNVNHYILVALQLVLTATQRCHTLNTREDSASGRHLNKSFRHPNFTDVII